MHKVVRSHDYFFLSKKHLTQKQSHYRFSNGTDCVYTKERYRLNTIAVLSVTSVADYSPFHEKVTFSSKQRSSYYTFHLATSFTRSISVAVLQPRENTVDTALTCDAVGGNTAVPPGR